MAITKDSLIVETITLDDRQEVYLTDKAQSVRKGNRAVGDKVSLHPKQAEAFINSGKATAKPVAATKTKEDTV